jgi:hypothetical protein
LLTSLGWTLTRNTLSHREKRIIFGVFGVYILVSFANTFCDEVRGGDGVRGEV